MLLCLFAQILYIMDVTVLFFQRMFKRLDLKKDGHIDFSEFVQYVTEHERQLKISFKELDKNNDGSTLTCSSTGGTCLLC